MIVEIIESVIMIILFSILIQYLMGVIKTLPEAERQASLQRAKRKMNDTEKFLEDNKAQLKHIEQLEREIKS